MSTTNTNDDFDNETDSDRTTPEPPVDTPETIDDVDEWGEDTNIFGTPYNVDLEPVASSGGKILAAEGDDGEMYVGSTFRKMMERAAAYPTQATWLGYSTDKTGLRTNEVPLEFDSWFQHAFLPGSTGSGKTTTENNVMVQLAYAGWGFVFIDPGGDASKDLLQRIPEHRLDDVIYIQPPTGDYDKVTALNFLDVPQREDEPEPAYDARVGNVVEDIISIVGGEEEMYARMTRVLRASVRAMIEADQPYTILDVAQLIDSKEMQKWFVEEHDVDSFVQDSIERVHNTIEQAELEPLSGRLEQWALNKTARRVISHQQSSFDIREAVEDGKIIIVNSNPGQVSGTIGRLIASAIVQRVWATVKSRSEEHISQRRPYWLIIDELAEAVSEQTDLDDILSNARKYRLALLLATQYPAQLHDKRRESVLNNTKITLALRQEENESAYNLANQLGDLDVKDITGLSDYEMFSQIITEDGLSEPVRFKTLPPYPPLRSRDDVENVIERSLDRYGTDGETLQADQTAIKQLMNDGSVTMQSNDTPDEVENIPTATVLQAVHDAAIREHNTSKHEYVSLNTVETALTQRVEHDLGHISKFANVIEQLPDKLVETDRQSGDIVVRLTEDGRSHALHQDTGAGVSGGGHKHRHLLTESYEMFTRLGCTVELPDQDEGGELADELVSVPVTTDPSVAEFLDTNPDIDGVPNDIDSDSINELTSEQLNRVNDAMRSYEDTIDDQLRDLHPSLPLFTDGRDISAEIETSTMTAPGQALQNLKKAVNNDKKCVFVVPDGNHSSTRGINSFSGWAVKGANILTNPAFYSEDVSYGRELYTAPDHLTVDDMPVLRRKQHGTTATWVDLGHDPDADDEWHIDNSRVFVLENTDGDEIMRVTGNDLKLGVDEADVPVWGGYDRRQQQHVVYTMQSDGSVKTKTYEDSDAFKDEWVKVSRPFVPEEEFDREPTTEDWEIVVIPDGDNDEYDGPQLFRFHGFTDDGDRMDWGFDGVFDDTEANASLSSFFDDSNQDDTDDNAGSDAADTVADTSSDGEGDSARTNEDADHDANSNGTRETHADTTPETNTDAGASDDTDNTDDAVTGPGGDSPSLGFEGVDIDGAGDFDAFADETTDDENDNDVEPSPETSYSNTTDDEDTQPEDEHTAQGNTNNNDDEDEDDTPAEEEDTTNDDTDTETDADDDQQSFDDTIF